MKSCLIPRSSFIILALLACWTTQVMAQFDWTNSPPWPPGFWERWRESHSADAGGGFHADDDGPPSPGGSGWDGGGGGTPGPLNTNLINPGTNL